MTAPCRCCGRELDDCGTCACVATPLGSFLADCVADCIGPARPAVDPQYWRWLAEEHGDCLREFVEVGAQPALCYEQALVAAHFGRLWMKAQEEQALPSLEAPAQDAACQHCGRPLTFTDPGWCSHCDGGEA